MYKDKPIKRIGTALRLLGVERESQIFRFMTFAIRPARI